MKNFALLLSLLLGLTAHAQNQDQNAPLAHESELSVVTVDGTTNSEAYNAKQKTTATAGDHKAILTGSYLQSRNDVAGETARAWDAGLRYEREFSERWSGFAGLLAESNPYAGYVQRDSAEAGVKHFLIRSEKTNWFIEAGYRNTTVRPVGVNPVTNIDFARLYTEYAAPISESAVGKLWIEHLPNLDRDSAYLTNAEASVAAALSKVLSLKIAYLYKYQNEPPAGARQAERKFTTSLVANF